MGVAIYCVLLALTALFGLPDIDRKFDIENALGTQNLSPSDKGLEVVSVTQIPTRRSCVTQKRYPYICGTDLGVLVQLVTLLLRSS